VPCDVILLQSSEPKGVCFIETKNLDGETNLKIKNVNKDLCTLFSNEEASFNNLSGKINCEKPNNAIYKFEGNMELS